ncbi:hypothetical protein GJAV_G00199740 [Gymnothorax javanicus]|nr:hypothetical protein GJAV_G00199740 [Gymnothorax javanicus]
MEPLETPANQQMVFQQLLLKVEQSLSREDVQAWTFLCADLLKRDVSAISTGQDLLTQLQQLDLLTPEDPSLLAELLLLSKRNDLLHQLSFDRCQPTRHVSPYRKMLFDLSENITMDDLKNIKFLLYNTIPRKKLEHDQTMLNLLLEMEKEGYFSSTNLEMLEDIIGKVCPNLRRKIVQYKEEYGKFVQETRGSYVMAQTTLPEPFSGYPADQTQPRQGAFSFGNQPASLEPHASSQVGSSQDPGTLSSHLSAISPPSLDTPDARMEAMSLSHVNSSGTNDSAFSSVESHSEHFNSSCAEKYLSGAEPSPGTKPAVKSYAMKEDGSRGVCLIINNHDFSRTEYRNRNGTEVDEECLTEVFTWLGFETRTERECTEQRMHELLEQLGQEDHSDRDCVVCFLLSHGKKGGVLGVDGGKLSLRAIMKPFMGVRCPSLRGKPKLFFIQACQGCMEQEPVPIESDSLASAMSDITADAMTAAYSIPNEADFLLAMASVPNFVSFRNTIMGTWFIQSLCQNLVELVPRGYDLLTILTKVNDDVSRKAHPIRCTKQMPQPAYSLRKMVVFPVPKTPAPQL